MPGDEADVFLLVARTARYPRHHRAADHNRAGRVLVPQLGIGDRHVPHQGPRPRVERDDVRVVGGPEDPPLDQSAAAAAGALAAGRRRIGRTVEFRDAMIAGIVVARKASLATGNGRHFEGLDLTIIDPWSFV